MFWFRGGNRLGWGSPVTKCIVDGNQLLPVSLPTSNVKVNLLKVNN